MTWFDAGLVTARSRWGLACCLAWSTWLGCGSDDSESSKGSEDASVDGGDGGSEGSTMKPAEDDEALDEAVLAACPQSTTLIETSDWTTCLEGRRLTGVEPFSNMPCELRFGANGAIEYWRGGELAIAVPSRDAWGDAYGSYQNDASGASRFFLASVTPDLAAVEGEPRVTDVDISLFALEGQDDTVAVNYLDENLARQTYNCTVDAP